MSLLEFFNNAQTTLAGSISNVATTATLATGTGALFSPAPVNGQYFIATLNDSATGLLFEVVHVTSVVGDVITMIRGQEGTTALNWLAGDIFVNDVTAGTMGTLQQTLTYPGNPNGFVAGVAATGGLSPTACWDTSENIMWMCTTTGSAANAVWKAVLLAPIANDTVLGNVSGGSASASALSQTQLTSLVLGFTSSLSGAVIPWSPISGVLPGTVFLNASGGWAVRRIRLSSATTYHTNFTSGSDSTGDGSAGNPWKTLQYAWNTISANVDCGGQVVTISQDVGVDTGGLVASSLILNAYQNIINIVINGGINGTGIGANRGVVLGVSGTGTIINNILGGNDLLAGECGIIMYNGGGTLGVCSSAKIHAQNGGVIYVGGNYTSNGNASYEWHADGGRIIFTPMTLTLTGTPAYSGAFCISEGATILTCGSVTFSGSATGSFCQARRGGGIDFNSRPTTDFPGNSSGVIDGATFGFLV